MSNPGQILNADFAQDPDFLELWIKKNRNNFFGNRRVDTAINTINKSTLVIIFGCSYGKTDDYLWNVISTWLSKNERRRLLVLDYDTPPMGSSELLKTQSSRRSVKGHLFNSMKISPDQSEPLFDRLWIENSGIVFKELISNKMD